MHSQRCKKLGNLGTQFPEIFGSAENFQTKNNSRKILQKHIVLTISAETFHCHSIEFLWQLYSLPFLQTHSIRIVLKFFRNIYNLNPFCRHLYSIEFCRNILNNFIRHIGFAKYFDSAEIYFLTLSEAHKMNSWCLAIAI